MPTTTRLEVHPIDHGVIFFCDQEFDADQHKRLARRFGAIFVQYRRLMRRVQIA
jgi:hypothetical protein